MVQNVSVRVLFQFRKSKRFGYRYGSTPSVRVSHFVSKRIAYCSKPLFEYSRNTPTSLSVLREGQRHQATESPIWKSARGPAHLWAAGLLFEAASCPMKGWRPAVQPSPREIDVRLHESHLRKLGACLPAMRGIIQWHAEPALRAKFSFGSHDYASTFLVYTRCFIKHGPNCF